MLGSPEERLKSLLHRIGPDRIWRPVLAPDGRVLAPGVGHDEDGPDALPKGIDLTGKSVADLGCNFGRYVFWAIEQGARRAFGVDSDADAVSGARLLAEWRGLSNAVFHVSDFLDEPPVFCAEVVLLIDFIGKQTIAKGRLDAALRAAGAYAEKEIIATIRPVYKVRDLPVSGSDALDKAYGAAFVRNGKFHLADYVEAFLRPEWDMALLTDDDSLEKKYKYTIRFTRKT